MAENRNEYANYVPLFDKIDEALKAGDFILAIDGRSAAGKTTLCALLESLYNCNVFHMDDFFLRPSQRTAERLSAAGENIDHERFLKEVLIPLSRRSNVEYIKYNCQTASFEAPEIKLPKKFNIIEGVYSMHPNLIDYYSFKVFLDISPELQRERISKRNSYELTQRFFNEWIPMEERYFESLSIRSKADMLISE